MIDIAFLLTKKFALFTNHPNASQKKNEISHASPNYLNKIHKIAEHELIFKINKYIHVFFNFL